MPCKAGRAPTFSRATGSLRGPNRWPRPMPAISSVISPCWATGGPFCWASRSHRRARASTSSSKAPAGPPFHGRATGGRPWGPCCGNTSSAKPCTPWASPPPAAWQWSPRGSRSFVKPRCRGRFSPAPRPATSAWARSSMRQRGANSTNCRPWPITPSAATFPTWPQPQIPIWPCWKPSWSDRLPWWPAGCWWASSTAS